MAYIGNIPAESYASFETETFSVSATTNYTLSHAVTNENEIRLVINGVVQQPGSGKAYTASGTTLTLSSATVSGDSMYAVYLGRALQTVNPPNASVGNSQTAPTIITGQTAETSIATDDTILIHDTSASALRKMTRANFVSGIGGTNTPAFYVTPSTDQSNIADNTLTQITFGQENFDTDNAFASSTFTVPSGEDGKYFFNVTLHIETNSSQSLNTCEIYFYINDAQNIYTNTQQNAHTQAGLVHTGVLDLSAGDTVKVYARVDVNNGGTFNVNQDNPANTSRCWWIGYKLIT